MRIFLRRAPTICVRERRAMQFDDLHVEQEPSESCFMRVVSTCGGLASVSAFLYHYACLIHSRKGHMILGHGCGIDIACFPGDGRSMTHISIYAGRHTLRVCVQLVLHEETSNSLYPNAQKMRKTASTKFFFQPPICCICSPLSVVCLMNPSPRFSGL